MKEKIDYILNKLLPKKLIVLIIGTIFVFMKLLDGQLWFYLALVYIGGNIVQKFVKPTELKPPDKE